MRRICLSPEYKSDYESLFDIGYESADELTQQYAAAFGSSYDAMDPTLANLFATVEEDDRNYDYEKDICSGVKLFHTMGLDMVIQSCIFAILDGVCSGEDTDDLETFLGSIEWRLPDVRFSYGKLCAFFEPVSLLILSDACMCAQMCPRHRLRPRRARCTTSCSSKTPRELRRCARRWRLCTLN